MTLTENRDVNRYVDQELRTLGVLASEHIWKGALVGLDRASGFVRNLLSGDLFIGIAYEDADNTDGDNGEIAIRVYTQGDFILKVNGVSRAVIGTPVYAIDNEQTTLANQPGQSHCGILIDVVGPDRGIVRLAPTLAAQVEHVAQIPLSSLSTGPTKNHILLTQRSIRIVSLEVWFDTVPDVGTLNVGVDDVDPDEIINNFNLASLAPQTLTSLIPYSRDVAKGQCLWARVGQASSSPGEGGLLCVRYYELP